MMIAARTWLRLGIVLGTGVAACTFTHGSLRESDSPDALVPDGGTCVAASVECATMEVLRTCGAPGEAYVDTPCAWGCLASGVPHCAVITPSGGGVLPSDTETLTALAAVTLTTGLIVNGETGAIGSSADLTSVRGAVTGLDNGIDFALRGSANTIGMFRFKRLIVSGDIKVVGGNAIAFVVDEGIAVDGVIDARGACTFLDVDLPQPGGPGGFPGAAKQSNAMGSGGGQTPSSSNKGGGGGGTGGSGGEGGNGGGGAGSAWADAVVSQLVGGGGGGGGSGGANSGAGGGGGGALQLVANGPVEIMTGGINAGGCGGRSGTGGNDGGGGGGAGGTILIEAPIVMLFGALAVNGGGGGGADTNSTTVGTAGSGDRTRAPGAPGDSAANGAAGGLGGAGSNREGGVGSNANGDGGGGGGGIGRIRINSRTGVGATIGSNAVLSPGPNDPNSTFTMGSAAVQ